MRYDDAYLDGLRAVGDPSVDRLVEDLARSGDVRAVSRVLRSLVDNDQPVPAELPDAMERWLEETAQVPAWVDRERMERGCQLVIDPAVIPPDLAASRELAGAIMRRSHRHSEEGVLMTRALFEMHANSLPAGFEGVAAAVTRFLVGDEICGYVGVPRSRWDRMIGLPRGAVRLLDRAQSARGPIGSLTQLLSAGMLNQRAVRMAGRRSASFSIPVPDGLQQRWTASGVFPQVDPELIGMMRAEER